MTTSESPRPEGGTEPGARPPRLIQNEATTEIPVHLLFRDEPDPHRQPPLSGPPRPAQRGEVLPALIAAAPAAGGVRRPFGPGAGIVRGAHDPAFVERPGRALPGTAGVMGGVAGLAGGILSLWWAGVLPDPVVRMAGLPGYAGAGLGAAQWAALAGAGTLALFGFGGLARGQVGRAWATTLFGRYRGTVRRSGLLWVNPLLLRRRVDVRLRHWRSEPMPAVDANGVALRVVVLVVWRVRDTARAVLGVEDHQTYLRVCVEAALARVLSRRPADGPFPVTGAGPVLENAATLRDTEGVGAALTRLLAADVERAGIEVFSAQPVRIEYADPEVAAVMQRRRIAALDAQHRDTVLTSVVDSVEDTVTRLTTRGLVELDDYERKALVKDLTVAFYTTGRGAAEGS